MAVYNTERYLREAIESILTQTLGDFELVIVDDGSTDNSPSILNDFATQDSRIKLITQANAGIGAATNRAIAESRGEYLAIMDSDDISLPNRLALQKAFLDRHPNIGAVGSQWRILTIDERDAGIDTHPVDSETIETLMFAYFSLHHPTTMIRRQAIERDGAYSKDRACLVPDYDLFMRMLLTGCKFANLPEVLFIWRKNPASTTRSKTAEQAQSVAQVRDWGFTELLRDNPEKAKSIARSIIYSFPTGTWQDFKIRQLFPKQQESLLYQTWETIIPDSAEDQFKRALVLWLRKPQEHFQILYDQLQQHEMPYQASLVSAYHGANKALPASGIKLPDISEKSHYVFSLFIPFVGDREGFKQRVEQSFYLQKKSEFSIELIVFSATEEIVPTLTLFPDDRTDCIVIENPYGWEKALINARGNYFAYLEENFRFNTDRFVQAITQLVNGKTDILYLLDERYFAEALDIAGKPLLDNSHVPNWSRSTLFGNDRIQLTGFIHQRSLLKEFKGNLKECGQIAGRVLARYLAIKNSFNIVPGAARYFIPAIHLNGQPMPVFQKMILDWYYDYGMTGLPAQAFWSNLSKPTVKLYARSLSDAWLKNDMFIHPGNSRSIEEFYLKMLTFPIRWPLFRHLLLHNKKSILTSLLRNKAFLTTLLALVYCSFIVLINRAQALFNR